MRKKPDYVFDQPALTTKKAAKRHRRRFTYSLDESTRNVLEAVVRSGDAQSMSRAIDVLAQFYASNITAACVHFEPKERARIVRHFICRGEMVAEGLARLARESVALADEKLLK